MDERINAIKSWLGIGSINIFGLPMSGKDTVGIRLAEALGAKFISSGMIIRAMEQANGQTLTHDGSLIESNTFYNWVLPYFEREELWKFPLVLSSIGRWAGEEDEVMAVARTSGHTIRAVIELQLSDQDVVERWEAAKMLGDRGLRADDADPQVFQKRLDEYHTKTLPVLKHYQELGILVPVPADLPRDKVFEKTIEALAKFASRTGNFVPEL